MSEQQIAVVETFHGRRVVVVHELSVGRGVTTLRLERSDCGEWYQTARIVVPNASLWLLRDALDAACALAAREAR